MVVCAQPDERDRWKTLEVCGEEAARCFDFGRLERLSRYKETEIRMYSWPEFAPLLYRVRIGLKNGRGGTLIEAVHVFELQYRGNN